MGLTGGASALAAGPFRLSPAPAWGPAKEAILMPELRQPEDVARDTDAVYDRAVAEFLAPVLEEDAGKPDARVVAQAHEAGLAAVAEHIRRLAREDR